MNCGMVPDCVGFQFGRYGVSLSLSFLILRQWSTSSSQLLGGSFEPACVSMGSVVLVVDELSPALGRRFEASLLQHGLVVHEDEQAREVREADDGLSVLAPETVEVGRAHLLSALVHFRQLVEAADHPALVPALAVVVGAVHHIDGVAAESSRL